MSSPAGTGGANAGGAMPTNGGAGNAGAGTGNGGGAGAAAGTGGAGAASGAKGDGGQGAGSASAGAGGAAASAGGAAFDSTFPTFIKHTIASFGSGYMTVIADIDHDGKPDVVALSSGSDGVVWFKNPAWEKHTITTAAKRASLGKTKTGGEGPRRRDAARTIDGVTIVYVM